MAEAMFLPYHFVDFLKKPGLACKAGTVPLDAYLCLTKSNGGNDSADSLLGQLRWMKDGGNGTTLNSQAGGVAIDLAWKGQGKPETFVKIWDFMCRNKEALKKLKVEVCAARDDPDVKIVKRTGNVFDLYFKDRSDKAAIEAMIDDRFFGIDCIGFVSNFLVWCGEWSEYKGVVPSKWAAHHHKIPVHKVQDLKPLDVLLWGGHIAIVDWVWKPIDGDKVEIDVCQSSAGGPQCNERAILRDLKVKNSDGRWMFDIFNAGSRPMPVRAHCYAMRREGFFW